MRRSTAALALLGATLTTVVPGPSPSASAADQVTGEVPGEVADQGADRTVQRAYGEDRIATTVSVSREHHGAAGHALLATAGDFPDALGASALAGRLDAPLLLTEPAGLAPAVGEELRRLGVHTVWVLGGETAVSAGVEAQLVADGYLVWRLDGPTRYATAAAVAVQAGPAPTDQVVLALGEHAYPDRAWPDAIAAGSLAATPDRVPTLLTAPDRLPEETERALAELGAASVLLVGGPAGIGEGVEARLRALGYAVERIAGGSRYETSVLLAGRALARFPDGDVPVVLASGEAFPDALSASALAASAGGPLVLVPPADLGGAVDGFLRGHPGRLARAVMVGGPAAADDFVLDQVGAALRGEPAPAPPAALTLASAEVVRVFEGKASWYGPGFAGRRTACGQRFDPSQLTAAHKELPCGTRVRVTNTANGAQVVVEITDRGPYAGGRVLDLAEHAADVLGYRSAGEAYVRAEVLAG